MLNKIFASFLIGVFIVLLLPTSPIPLVLPEVLESSHILLAERKFENSLAYQYILQYFCNYLEGKKEEM